ncbi:hypothetical protein DFH05DRAFT_1474725 [Lentinula detonsa]|uniref:Uncharacterized protein n=1 Tax=Lentinula detonsa TaxID=2804962 RepID=A0A9W8U1P0_9AGAR|nr:hypothetical protein DFH05DRAFT_1474725 [Lentinula detonsa]
MAGHASGGFNPHLPGFRYNFLAKGLGATMWFFIFYRFRQDGGKLLVRHYSFSCRTRFLMSLCLGTPSI